MFRRQLNWPVEQIKTIIAIIGENDKIKICRQYEFIGETKWTIYKISFDGSLNLDFTIKNITKVVDSRIDEKEYFGTCKKNMKYENG